MNFFESRAFNLFPRSSSLKGWIESVCLSVQSCVNQSVNQSINQSFNQLLSWPSGPQGPLACYFCGEPRIAIFAQNCWAGGIGVSSSVRLSVCPSGIRFRSISPKLLGGLKPYYTWVILTYPRCAFWGNCTLAYFVFIPMDKKSYFLFPGHISKTINWIWTILNTRHL